MTLRDKKGEVLYSKVLPPTAQSALKPPPMLGALALRPSLRALVS